MFNSIGKSQSFSKVITTQLAAVLILLSLSACGGGGGGADSSAPQARVETSSILSVKRGILVSKFSLPVQQAGMYEVKLRWPLSAKPTGPARVSIDFAGGRHTLELRYVNRGAESLSAGAYRFVPDSPGLISITDSNGQPLALESVELSFLGTDASAADGVFAESKLPSGVQGLDFGATLQVKRGMPPYKFALAGGELPAGLQLDGESGLISGRPQRAGSWTFVVTALDQRQARSAQEFSISIYETVGGGPEPLGLTIVEQDRKMERRMSAGEKSSEAPALLSTIALMAEGEWKRVNINTFRSVWTPKDLRQLIGDSDPTPASIITAWSSFAWDSKRNLLFLYGGGHANYRGNDTYIWRADTQFWERASLPSAMVQTPLGAWNAVDGVANAPASAHTYDNNIYLPGLDRVLVLGGAADPNGGHFLTQSPSDTSLRITGPYLFDTGRADPNKVGGTTGSHVQRVAPFPEVLGGQMWSNRESWLNAATTGVAGDGFVESCTATTTESGRDVVYIKNQNRVWKYTIGDLANPAADRWVQVGRYYNLGSGQQVTCAFDPIRKALVSAHDATRPFIYWDMNAAAPENREVVVVPTDSTGEFSSLLASGAISMRNCGIEHDSARDAFKMWCGDGRVWTLKPPAILAPTGWRITREPTPSLSVPTESLGAGGVLGKWKYIPNLDVFMGLNDPVAGNIWIYKPLGWVDPRGATTNVPPTVAVSAPVAGASFSSGSNITITAAASDSDGSITKVEILVNGVSLGDAASPPYSVVWRGVQAGSYIVIAIATDNAGAKSMSEPVTIEVTRTFCADEGGTCTLPAGVVGDVFFGANGAFNAQRGITGSIECNRSVFGDPIPGAAKACSYEVVSRSGNLPPSVSLTSPAAGAVFAAGTAVTVTASASDNDGSVARVEFYDGTTLVGSSTAAPYRVTWTTVAGTRSLTARAFDNSGAQTISLAVVVSVNAPVSTRIFCANESGICTLPSGFTADVYYGANASFNIRRNVLGSIACTNAVFGDPIPGVAKSCSYEVTGTSSNLPPTVALTSPLTGATLAAGAAVTISASASDTDGSIARVAFYDGSTLIGTSTSAPYSVTWSAVAGTRSLTARAFDNVGAQTTSVAVVVTVNATIGTRTFCANENSICTLPVGVSATVYYGANASFNMKPNLVGSIACTNAVFGDPIAGVPKSCSYEVTSISGNLPPMVSLTSPAVGATFAAGTAVTITASASDPDGSIARVEFYDGSTLVGTSTVAPFSASWTAVLGMRSLTARAFDNSSAQATSASLVVTVTVPTNRTFCANENGTCSLPIGMVADVYYGANTSFRVRQGVIGSVGCTNAVFGDPIQGVVKTCSYSMAVNQ